MAEHEPTQVAQIRSWVNGETHTDHDTFSMGKGYAEALLAYIDRLEDGLRRAMAATATSYGEQAHRIISETLFQNTDRSADSGTTPNVEQES